MTEEEVVETIYRVVDTLSSKFRFAYHSTEDMRQEGARLAIEALNRGLYDEERPLDNFLYVHIRNRFINYKRDTYLRNDLPCKSCIFYDPHLKKSSNQCAAFENKDECKKLSEWTSKNKARQNLMNPGYSNISESSENSESFEESEYEDFDQDLSFSEIKQKIRDELPLDVSTDYLRMLEGVKISKSRRARVKKAIMEIRERCFYAQAER